jgi:hypothetical protein
MERNFIYFSELTGKNERCRGENIEQRENIKYRKREKCKKKDKTLPVTGR